MRKAGIHRQQVEATLHFPWEDPIDETFIYQNRLAKRLNSRNIQIDLDVSAKAWLANEGYDPVFGARPLKRVIQNAIQNPIAEMLLSGDIDDNDKVHITAGSDGLIVGDRVGTSGVTPPEDVVVH